MNDIEIIDNFLDSSVFEELKNKMYSKHIEQKNNPSLEIDSKKGFKQDFKQSYYQQWIMILQRKLEKLLQLL